MKKIGICGAGTMGSGIALAALLEHLEVVIYDSFDNSREKCSLFIAKQLDKLQEKGKISLDQKETLLKSLYITGSLSDVQHCDIVIEAIIEESTAKNELFYALENIVSQDCILATNTSSIAVSSIASQLRFPERFIGMHFFNPANIMKLVEIIQGVQTAENVVEKTFDLAKRMKKSPVIVKDVPGFIVNRVARNYYNEAQRIVMEQTASLEQVDRIMKGNSFKMGPFELMDLIGIDVNFDVTNSIWKQYFYDARFEPSLLQKQYVDAKLFGRKSGRGFYNYTA